MQAILDFLRRSSRWAHLTVFVATVSGLTGCAQQNATPLPDLKPRAVDGMLVPAQQQKAINDLARSKAEAQAQAVKQIENSR